MPQTCVNSDLNSEEIFGLFFKKVLWKTNQREFRVEKVIKGRDNLLYVKWKGLDSSFNSWIDKKDIIWTNEYFPNWNL